MSKCRCGKDHTNDKPVNEKEVLNKFAEELRREIDKQVLEELALCQTKPQEKSIPKDSGIQKQ